MSNLFGLQLCRRGARALGVLGEIPEIFKFFYLSACQLCLSCGFCQYSLLLNKAKLAQVIKVFKKIKENQGIFNLSIVASQSNDSPYSITHPVQCDNH